MPSDTAHHYLAGVVDDVGVVLVDDVGVANLWWGVALKTHPPSVPGWLWPGGSL